jgi:hypothetical protein
MFNTLIRRKYMESVEKIWAYYSNLTLPYTFKITKLYGPMIFANKIISKKNDKLKTLNKS